MLTKISTTQAIAPAAVSRPAPPAGTRQRLFRRARLIISTTPTDPLAFLVFPFCPAVLSHDNSRTLAAGPLGHNGKNRSESDSYAKHSTDTDPY